jgi:aspartate aminotransferase
VTAKMIEAAITPKTKAIVLNTPSNPSGAVVSPADLEAIVRLAHARGIYVLLDECYVYLTFTGAVVSGGTFTDCKEHMVILGSLSKTYAMTGWRAGFALGPKQIISAMSKLQSQSTSNTTSFVQKASIAALTGFAGLRGEMRADYLKLRDRVLAGFKTIPGADLHGAAGGVLCVSECERVYREGRDQVGGGPGVEAADGGACGGGAGRGVWDERAYSAELRGVRGRGG